MARRLQPKAKKANLAASITPFLRENPNYEPFELPTVEVILMEDMKNKPGLTQLLSSFAKSGKLITEEERKIYEQAEDIDIERADETEERSATLKRFLALREQQKKLAIRDSASLNPVIDDNSSLMARCRLALDGLATSVVKSGRLKVEVDENDPSQFADTVSSQLASIPAAKFTEPPTLELIYDLVSGDHIDMVKYRKKLIHLEIMNKHLHSLQVKLRNAVYSFKNQRGGWKTDVFSLTKSIECKKPQMTHEEVSYDNFMNIEQMKHQVSNLKVTSEIVDPDHLDLLIKESTKLVSTIQKRV